MDRFFKLPTSDEFSDIGVAGWRGAPISAGAFPVCASSHLLLILSCLLLILSVLFSVCLVLLAFVKTTFVLQSEAPPSLSLSATESATPVARRARSPDRCRCGDCTTSDPVEDFEDVPGEDLDSGRDPDPEPEAELPPGGPPLEADTGTADAGGEEVAGDVDVDAGGGVGVGSEASSAVAAAALLASLPGAGFRFA
eukprot:g12941.t1